MSTLLGAGGVRSAKLRTSATSGAKTAATTSASVSLSAAIRAGDVILAIVVLNGNSDTIATPSGWALVAGPIDSTGTSTQVRGYLFRKTAVGGDSVTFVKTGTTNTWKITQVTYSSTAGVDVSASNAVASSGDLAPVLPSVTPTVNGGMIVGLIGVRSSVTDTTPPSVRWSEIIDSTTAPAAEICARGPVGTAATGTATAGISSSQKWVTFTVALKPAA